MKCPFFSHALLLEIKDIFEGHTGIGKMILSQKCAWAVLWRRRVGETWEYGTAIISNKAASFRWCTVSQPLFLS